MEYIYSRAVQFSDLSEEESKQIGYLRVAMRSSAGRMETIARHPWTVDELRRLNDRYGLNLPAPPGVPAHRDVLQAWEVVTRRVIEAQLGGGQTLEFQVRCMEPTGSGAVRSVSTRVTKPATDDDAPLSTDAPPQPSARLAENDATAATPGMRALSGAYETATDVFHKMTTGASAHMQRMEDLHERHYRRMEAELERERTNHQRTIEAHAAERLAWADERKTLNDQIIALATANEDVADKSMTVEEAAKKVDDLKRILGPLGPLVASQLPPNLAAAVTGGAQGTPTPGDQLLAALLASVPADKLAKLTPDLLAKKLGDRATIDTLLSVLGV